MNVALRVKLANMRRKEEEEGVGGVGRPDLPPSSDGVEWQVIGG